MTIQSLIDELRNGKDLREAVSAFLSEMTTSGDIATPEMGFAVKGGTFDLGKDCRKCPEKKPCTKCQLSRRLVVRRGVVEAALRESDKLLNRAFDPKKAQLLNLSRMRAVVHDMTRKRFGSDGKLSKKLVQSAPFGKVSQKLKDAIVRSNKADGDKLLNVLGMQKGLGGVQ